MGATLTTLTRDELLALSIETDNALMWAEIRNPDKASSPLRELGEQRRTITAEWARRDTLDRRHRNKY